MSASSYHSRREYGGDAPAESVVDAASWSATARLFSIAAQFALFLTAMRFLSPAAFGSFALTFAGYQLLSHLSASGWRSFNLHWRGPEMAVRQALSFAVAFGCALCVFGIFAALTIGVIVSDSAVTLLAMLLAGALLADPIIASLEGAIARHGNMRALARAEITAQTVGLCVGVAAFFNGWGLSALGAAILCAAAMRLCYLTVAAQLRPAVDIDIEFGRAIIAAVIDGMRDQLTRFAGAYAPLLIVGGFTGPAGAGLYHAAERLVQLGVDLIGEQARLASWFIFRKAAYEARDADGLREVLGARMSLFAPAIFMIAAPFFALLGILSENILTQALGAAWAPAAAIVTILAVARLIALPCVANEALLAIVDKGGALSNHRHLNALVLVASVTLGAPFGLEAAALSVLAASVFLLTSSAVLQSRHAGARWGRVLVGTSPVLIGATALVGGVFGARIIAADTGLPAGALLAIETIAGALAYLMIIALLRPSLFSGLSPFRAPKLPR